MIASSGSSAPDTIFAQATASGHGAIAIVRLSGPRAVEIALRIFASSRQPTRTLRSHRIHHGYVLDPATRRRIDETLLLYMKAGHSFTGEDLIELHCHGSAAVVRQIERVLRTAGARAAEPGEFTRRAFLNGRLTLDEAEAVNDLIRARSEEAALISAENLAGGIHQHVTGLRTRLLSLLALLEANVDFPEDDVDRATRTRVEIESADLERVVRSLGRTFERGQLLREGVRVVIAGEPNVGKSSLLNALLKTERAIVTEIPGTTRDTIEESLEFQGLAFVLVDTAGLRDTGDHVEQLGLQRAKDELGRAHIVLLVLDSTRPMTCTERTLLEQVRGEGKPCLVVGNKSDLPNPDQGAIGPPSTSSGQAPGEWIPISALRGDGIETMLTRLHAVTLETVLPPTPGPVVLNGRHRDCLERAGDSLASFGEGFRQAIPIDVCLVDLYEAAKHLGAITGEIVTDEILDEIFRRFCIGK